jgi:CBS domain containing-hemolysin-like protein
MNLFVVLGITLLFTAFFSGFEIAYLSANRLRIELKSLKGFLSGRILSFFVKHPSHFFTTTLVGNNIAVVFYSIYFTKLLLTYGAEDHSYTFLLHPILSSIIILILGEFLPKALFRSSPNRALGLLSLPFMLIYYLFYPLVMLIVFLSQGILRLLFNTRVSPEEPEFSRYDLFHYVAESNTADEQKSVEVDKQIFKNAIEFPSLRVRECMIPRTEIDAIEVTETIEKVKQVFIDSGHSKLLVYRESIDNIIGYIHLVDLYRNPKSIDKIVMPIIIATESMPASELMKQLIEKRRSMAVVVDEFGGTSGMITIEDVIEQIIGEIEDEHDVDDFVETKISDSEYIFSARLDIDYLNDTYDLQLPEGDYETLGGLIFYIHQNIPKEGTIVEMPPFQFTVLSMQQARINEVRLKITSRND